MYICIGLFLKQKIRTDKCRNKWINKYEKNVIWGTWWKSPLLSHWRSVSGLTLHYYVNLCKYLTGTNCHWWTFMSCFTEWLDVWANQKSAVFIILCDISSFCGPRKFIHKSILNNSINLFFFVYCVVQVCMVNTIQWEWIVSCLAILTGCYTLIGKLPFNCYISTNHST